MSIQKKLLLCGIFGPYGIKDEYAEGLGMQMELLNNQITREQNIHSIRQHYWTLPLYLMAENISVPSVVLDFPQWEDFTEELEQGYSHVGINFIVPNVLKVKRMTEYIRANFPETKIILGGYGTIIPELNKILPYDEICKGEGITWLRSYFGEDPNAPIKHPIIQNPISQSVYGFQMQPVGSVIMPGVGCKNGCEFCITSHKFGKKYVPLLPTGKDIFEACERIHKAMGAEEFFVMDENFLKQPEKARELLAEMEKQGRSFIFEIFSSAEVVKELGVDFLVRLGVKMVWIGVESKANTHAKTAGIDFKILIEELQSHGISVNTSAILFLDHHTEETIQEDIDWTISLGADMTQFMNYTPYPTTALYERLKSEGRLKDMDYRYQTGQGELNWHHPHIPDPKKQFDYTKRAFKKKYEMNGSSVLNIAVTAIRGYQQALNDYELRKSQRLNWNPSTLRYEETTEFRDDVFFLGRIEMMKKTANQMRPVLLVNQVFAPNDKARKKALYARDLFNNILGKPTIKDNALAAGLLAFAIKASSQHAMALLKGQETVILQPPTNRVEFNIKTHAKELIIGQIKDVGFLKTSYSRNKFQDFLKGLGPLSDPITWVVNNIDRLQRNVDKTINKIGNSLYT
jgi:hypothetical protein